MSSMKCPFCEQELETGNYYVHCHCSRCNITIDMEGTEEMWEALIRAHKALALAKERLKNTILDAEMLATPEYLASRAKETLEQITALEPKETTNA